MTVAYNASASKISKILCRVVPVRLNSIKGDRLQHEMTGIIIIISRSRGTRELKTRK